MLNAFYIHYSAKFQLCINDFVLPFFLNCGINAVIYLNRVDFCLYGVIIRQETFSVYGSVCLMIENFVYFILLTFFHWWTCPLMWFSRPPNSIIQDIASVIATLQLRQIEFTRLSSIVETTLIKLPTTPPDHSVLYYATLTHEFFI